MMDKSLDELKGTFNVLLDLPYIEVDEVERDREGNYRVTIHSTEHGTRCHQCGHFIDHFYGHGEFITLRHLPLFGRQVEPRLRPPRYQCQRCPGRLMTTQRATWYDVRSRCGVGAQIASGMVKVVKEPRNGEAVMTAQGGAPATEAATEKVQYRVTNWPEYDRALVRH